MRITTIVEASEFSINYYDPESDEDYRLLGDSFELTNNIIRLDRDKELLLTAIRNGKVVGCVWYSITRSSVPGYEYEYSFDVAVDEASRGALVGPRLIEAAIRDFTMQSSEYGDILLKCLVVNEKLARYLKERYGFTHMSNDGDINVGNWSMHSPYMVYLV